MNRKKSPQKLSNKNNKSFFETSQKANLQRELYEWDNMFSRIVNMISSIVELPNIPLDTSANKRYVLEEMCSVLCQKAKYPEINDFHQPKTKSKQTNKKSNSKLKQKVKKYQNEIDRLRSRKSDLEYENQSYRRIIQQQNEILAQKRSSPVDEKQLELEEKIKHVESIIKNQMNNTPNRSKSPKKKSTPIFDNELKENDSDDSPSFLKKGFDPRTTKAISKYRKISRKQAAMEGKVVIKFPYRSTPREPTPTQPISQECINLELKKLPSPKRTPNPYSTIFYTPRKPSV
ncbi:hypothetical protein TRFO_10255 [Tritrichomonas foetus]|uniref:Uncharacterized protein n=1 Tax=Tritrichomonas foetus TaxID=1144522 RepID=A0A1J4J9I9_9EUKA|nr:hypothetical protein TRFO_10255 [Tritrichomonas foetus]|eukprot:OHS95854.1 hypothetical protein TRFO_10255 [Tritrichomonas foetus]